ncbi:glycerophosphodiester phosphodiesterase 1 [Anabrus simplex]|uniref:glycerophosphodiester phosphodiesterase 1 n=1 Tax=Anabrus simplex TaxID=316456 RepID=UPI0035A3B57B
MAASLLEIFFSSVVGWFYIYGTWLFASELIFCAIPLTAVGCVILFIIVNFMRVPSPDVSVEKEIFGYDLLPYDQGYSDSKEEENYKMKVVAHRGACLDAPENSLTAIRKAKEKGCTAVEVDVALTCDEVPILFHDDDVDRLTDSTGLISDLTWKKLQELDIAAKHPCRDKFGQERVARFEDAIKECLKLDMRMFLDLKGDNMKLVSVILEAFEKHEALYRRAVVSSFNPLLIYLIRRADPHIVCSMAWRPHYFTFESYSGLAGEGRPRHKSLPMHLLARVTDAANTWLFDNLTFFLLGLSAVLIHKDQVTMDMVQRWHRRGVRVIPWTVNLPSEKQFFSRVLKVPYMTDTLETQTL